MNKVNLQAIVLSVRRYSFTDDKTGELLQGCKVTYLDGLEEKEIKQNQKGLNIITATFPYTDFEKFNSLPAYYNISFELSVNGKGQPFLRAKEAEFIEGFKAVKRCDKIIGGPQ